MSRFATLVVVEILLFAPLSASAKTLYVDGSAGNDSTTYAANGPSSPWRTIGRAAWGSANRGAPNAGQAALAGDTVRIVTGTYTSALSTGTGRYDVLYNPVNSGTSGNPIIFIAQGTVAIEAPSWGGPVIGANSVNYIVWNGPFLIDETRIETAPDTGPVVFHASIGSGIDGATISGAGATWADNHNGIRFDASQGCFARNNTIRNFKSAQGPTSQNGACIMMYDSQDIVMEHNDISGCGAGIFVKGQTQGQVQRRITIRFNDIHDMLNQTVVLLASTDSRIYQNVLRDSPIGVTIFGNGPGDAPTNDIVANNTLDNLSSVAVLYRGSSYWQNLRIWNNIITNTQYAYQSDSVSGPGSSTNNHSVYFAFPSDRFAGFTGGNYSFAAWRTAFGQDSLSTTTNPMYRNPATDDFRLDPSSPVLGLGRDILDLDGDGSTTDSINPGAYVTGSEVIGPGPVDPPGVPTHVRIIRS